MILILVVVLAILATIGGYFFLNNFEKYDNLFFKKMDLDYQSFGKMEVLVCAILGGCFILESYLVSYRANFFYILSISGVTCYLIFDTINRLRTSKLLFLKLLWGILSCCVGFIIGCIGSVVIIVSLIVWILIMGIIGTYKRANARATKEQVKQYNNEAEELESESLHMHRSSQSEIEEHERKVQIHNQKNPSEM